MRISRKLAVAFHRAGLGLRFLVAFVAVVLAGLLLFARQTVDLSGDLSGAGAANDSSNLQIFLLVNGLISVVIILAFLVARNLVKLFFDRRRGLLGARLRLKLALSIMFLTLVPTALLFTVASGIITQAFDGLINSQVESAIDGSLEIARNYESLNELRIRSDARALQRMRFTGSDAEFHERLERERSERNLYSIAILERNGILLADARAATSSIDEFAEPQPDLTTVANPAELGLVRREREEANEFLRWYGPFDLDGKSTTLVVTIFAPPELTHAKAVISEWFQEYEQLKLFRGQLRSGALLTLLLITLVFLFAALWWGFYLAREITGPLMRVIEGTQSVARGNYDVVVRASGGGDEVAILVQSFNRMTRDLRSSRTESEAQRRFIESALAQIGVGVIGVTVEGVISLVNERARAILSAPTAAAGQQLSQVFPEELQKPCADLISTLFSGKEVVVEREIHLKRSTGERKLVVTGSLLHARGRREVVMTLDDVTELSQAQALFAWREIARRLAHEIKNPLTPIQLSAQRLERLVANTPLKEQAGDVVQTIVNNVESIKRLTNEFSKFARMPTAEMQVADLNAVVDEVVRTFAISINDIAFQVELDRTLPACLFDREQMRRALVNLIDNAVQSHRGATAPGGETPRVTVRTAYEVRRSRVSISVSDNGPGVPEAIRSRIFNPYVSMRAGGTGLGLSIVQSIVADHEGLVTYEPVAPRGARFLIEFPIRGSASSAGGGMGRAATLVSSIDADIEQKLEADNKTDKNRNNE